MVAAALLFCFPFPRSSLIIARCRRLQDTDVTLSRFLGRDGSRVGHRRNDSDGKMLLPSPVTVAA
jgi:hypothetical protein